MMWIPSIGDELILHMLHATLTSSYVVLNNYSSINAVCTQTWQGEDTAKILPSTCVFPTN
jgi:hypothetical protein